MQRRKNKNNSHIPFVTKNKYSVGIVVSDFNADITHKLLDGALRCLKENGFKDDHITVVHVPGAFEIPLMCQHLARTKKFDGLIALGAVIKGDTDHYYYISNETSQGIMAVMLQESISIAFGVITVSNLKQAKERSGLKDNKGAEATEALLKMIENFQ